MPVVIFCLSSIVGIFIVEKWFWKPDYSFGSSRRFWRMLVKGALIILSIALGLGFALCYLFKVNYVF